MLFNYFSSSTKRSLQSSMADVVNERDTLFKQYLAAEWSIIEALLPSETGENIYNYI